MRVVHVIEGMHQGGAESLILEHVRHAEAGTETMVCALNRGGPSLDAARALGARTVLLEKGGGHLGGLRRLVKLLRAERPYVVNGHNPTGGLYATIASSLAGAGTIVRTEHSVHYAGRHSPLYPFLFEPALTARASAVICVCRAVRESHARRLPWAAGRFVTILNGISEAPLTRARDVVRGELGVAPGESVVLTVGSLTPQKAQLALVEAFASIARGLPGARLLIAGEGPLGAALRGRVRELGVEGRVRLLGARTDVPDLMAAADVFVLSSVREGLSVTLLEAMRAARPVVVTDIGGNAEAVAAEETGIVVPPGDPPRLAQALSALLADPARAAAMGAAGRERWLRCFQAERMVRETEALYRARRRRGRRRAP